MEPREIASPPSSELSRIRSTLSALKSGSSAASSASRVSAQSVEQSSTGRTAAASSAHSQLSNPSETNSNSCAAFGKWMPAKQAASSTSVPNFYTAGMCACNRKPPQPCDMACKTCRFHHGISEPCPKVPEFSRDKEQQDLLDARDEEPRRHVAPSQLVARRCRIKSDKAVSRTPAIDRALFRVSLQPTYPSLEPKRLTPKQRQEKALINQSRLAPLPPSQAPFTLSGQPEWPC